MPRRRPRSRPTGPLRFILLGVGVAVLCGTALGGDWPFYRHDAAGTSNPNEPLTPAEAAALSVRWTAPVLPIANPIVVGGSVYLTGADGAVHALDASTGIERWRRSSRVYGPFHCFSDTTSASWKGPVGAPAVVDGTVFMPGGDGTIYAYDASAGTIKWQTAIADVPTRGEFLWSSVFPLGNRIYIGVSSLHDCLLVPGRLVALDQASGAVVGTWWADAHHGPGGGLWTQPAYDPRTNRLFVTTGTIAEGLLPSQQPLADAFVAIDPITLQTLDSYAPTSGNYFDDFDFGTSPVLFDTATGRHLIAATAKNGFVYALDRDHLAAGVVWTYQVSGAGVSPDLGESSISSPVFANNTIFVAGGRTVDGYGGQVAALDPDTGRPRWVMHPPNGGFVLAAPTAVGGVLFVPATHLLGQPATLYALDQTNGSIAFSRDTGGALFAEPTFANGTLYFGDLDSTTWALAPSGSAPPPVDGGAPSGGTTFVDDFDRTSLGPNWTVDHGVFAISGGAAIGTAPSSYAFWVGRPAADARVGVALPRPTVPAYVGVITRADPSDPTRAHYAAFIGPDGTLGLARRNDWVYSYVGDGPQVSAGMHAVTLTASGTGPVTLTVTLDGSTTITAIDSSGQALSGGGRAGIFDYNGASQPLDHFTVGDTSSTAPPPTPPPTPPPPSTTVIARDDFTVPGPLGAAWTTWQGAFNVSSEAAHSAAARSYATMGAAVSGDVTVSAIVTPNGLNYSGVLARAQGDRNHYVGWMDQDGSVHVARRNDWSYTYLADATPHLTGARKLTLHVHNGSGVQLTLYVDDSPVIDVVDAGPNALDGAGNVGIFAWQGAGPSFQHFAATQP